MYLMAIDGYDTLPPELVKNNMQSSPLIRSPPPKATTIYQAIFQMH